MKRKGAILIITHLWAYCYNTIEEQINLLEYLERAHLANSTREEYGITISPTGMPMVGWWHALLVVGLLVLLSCAVAVICLVSLSIYMPHLCSFGLHVPPILTGYWRQQGHPARNA